MKKKNPPVSSCLESLEPRTLLSAVSIAAVDAVAGESGGTTASLLVSRDAPAPTDLIVKLGISGKASNGRDYEKVPATVTIVADQTSVAVPITVIDDAELELTEYATFRIKPSRAYTVNPGAASATVTILDDEMPTVNVQATKANASEAATNKPGYFLFSRNGPKQDPCTISVTIAGTATNGTDYAPITSLVIPAGASKLKVPVTVLNENLAEGSETVIATLESGGAHNVGPKSTATVTIADNDYLYAGQYFPMDAASRLFHVTMSGVGAANASYTMTPTGGSNSTLGLSVNGQNYVEYGYRQTADGLYETFWNEVFDGGVDQGTFTTLPRIVPTVVELGQTYTGYGEYSDGFVNVTSTILKTETINTALGRLSCLKVQIVLSYTGDNWTETDTNTVWLNADHGGIMKWIQKLREVDAGHVSTITYTATALN